eukprot:6210905-Pleurochrysis_carterae.AAC.1
MILTLVTTWLQKVVSSQAFINKPYAFRLTLFIWSFSTKFYHIWCACGGGRAIGEEKQLECAVFNSE